MWDWDLIWHMFRVFTAMLIALGMVAVIVFAAYLVGTITLTSVTRMYETIMDRRVKRRGHADHSDDRQG